MAQGRKMIWSATLALAATAAFAATAQQQSGGTTQQQQSIPDAPRPQALPELRTITPVGAAITPPAPQPDSASDGQRAPGTSLPSSPASQPGEEDSGPVPEASATSFKLTSRVNLIEVPFIVKDSKNQLVPGITYRDVRIYENGVRQQMAIFTTDPAPLSISLVIDQSVTFDSMEKINNSLGALQGAFTPYDEVSIFTYNNGVKQQTPFTGAQSARLGVILERSKGKGREPVAIGGGPLSQGIRINDKQIDQNTNGHPNTSSSFQTPEKEFHTMNDAIFEAAKTAAHAARGRRRIVYVISDGREYGSKTSEKEVIRYCLANKISVWATVVGENAIYGLGFLDRIHIPFTMRDNALIRYTNATAGQLDSEFRQAGIEKSFQQIASEARNQYTIGFYSKSPMLDGKYRTLDVRVLKPNLTVIAKPGYYPTAETRQPAQATPTAIP